MNKVTLSTPRPDPSTALRTSGQGLTGRWPFLLAPGWEDHNINDSTLPGS